MSDIKENLSAVLYAVDDLRMEHRSIPELKNNEVTIKMSCVGICGSDVHYWKKGGISHFILNAPMVLGHEGSGTVYKVGKGVTNLKIGDRVCIEPGVPCSRCNFCKAGKYNLCPEVKFCATPPIHGNISRYYNHSADFCYKLPDNVSLEEGALLEPLSVGVHACKKAKVSVGSKVLILGSGPIGLVTLLTAKSMGAAVTVITDVSENRLQFARKMGADYTINVANKKDTEILNLLRDQCQGLPDKTIDCAGLESTIKLAIQSTLPGGVIVIVGMGDSDTEVKVPLASALIKEIEIRGVFRYANDYKDSLSMVAKKIVNLEELVTHKFSLKDTQEAFRICYTGEGNPIKVMICCDK